MTTEALKQPWEPLGEAMLDYYLGNTMACIYIKSTVEGDRVTSLETFFREKDSFPKLEKEAFRHCRGKVLDVGAGSGPHAMFLQKKGLDVTGLDISPKSVEVMQKRGLKKAVCANIFDYEGDKYDTILMMMNGIGVGGDPEGVGRLLQHFKNILNPGGQLIFDSTDIGYVSAYERSLASLQIPVPDYYGTVYYQLSYKNNMGAIYPWVFLDLKTMKRIATENGYDCRVLKIYKTQYLCQLTFQRKE